MEHAELNRVFRRNCILAALVTIALILVRAAIIEGFLPGVTEKPAEEWVLLEVGIATLEAGNHKGALAFLGPLAERKKLSDETVRRVFPPLIRALLDDDRPVDAENILAEF